jgi:hypothetical protein
MTHERIFLDVGASLAGLVICLVYRRISPWMWALILCLGAALFFSVDRLCMITGISNANAENHGYPLYFADIWYSVCWALFLTALSLVFADVRKRQQRNSLEEKIAAFDKIVEEGAVASDSKPDLSSEIQARLP